MNADDFILSAIALFVFFFVVTPLLTRICERSGAAAERHAPAADKMPAGHRIRRAG